MIQVVAPARRTWRSAANRRAEQLNAGNRTDMKLSSIVIAVGLTLACAGCGQEQPKLAQPQEQTTPAPTEEQRAGEVVRQFVLLSGEHPNAARRLLSERLLGMAFDRAENWARLWTWQSNIAGGRYEAVRVREVAIEAGHADRADVYVEYVEDGKSMRDRYGVVREGADWYVDKMYLGEEAWVGGEELPGGIPGGVPKVPMPAMPGGKPGGAPKVQRDDKKAPLPGEGPV